MEVGEQSDEGFTSEEEEEGEAAGAVTRRQWLSVETITTNSAKADSLLERLQYVVEEVKGVEEHEVKQEIEEESNVEIDKIERKIVEDLEKVKEEEASCHLSSVQVERPQDTEEDPLHEHRATEGVVQATPNARFR